MVYALGRLAGVAAARGDAERAGRLWGALEAEEARGTIVIWQGERAALERPVFALTGPDFEHARCEGRQLPLDVAVASVLEPVEG